MKNGFALVEHTADLCVVGGGLAGLCAAVAAARRGAKVALMQERPMLGGNASSEIRMWVCGALGRDMLETGLIEEIMMENQYRNPDKNYSVWDGILYEKALLEPNIELLLNCSCNECEMADGAIASVTGWQLTTQQYHRVSAALFADCSGDSVLAPISGALYRVGREARAEFGEDIGPEGGDGKTMGMSCLIQAREESAPSDFRPPAWAYKFTEAELSRRVPDLSLPSENFWYLELGGEGDTIADTERLRDELLKIAYGVWDFIKNDPGQREKNRFWRLDWLGMLPGKRESRRYIGDHVLSQREVEAGGRFDDTVAYGGWPMDDHDPGGFAAKHISPNVNHPAPSPYGIPYRSLYSKNVPNLFFAGRNISATHAAISSTRVMATCATIGQAVGTAAAIAARSSLTPRGVYEKRLGELRQALMEDDCYIPFSRREAPRLTREARLICASPDAENLRNGFDRPAKGADNGARLPLGESVEYDFGGEVNIARLRLVFDSDLNRDSIPDAAILPRKNMLANRPLRRPDSGVPATMTRAFRVEGLTAAGEVITLFEDGDNYRRLRVAEVNARVRAVRFIPLATWGARECHLFSFDVY